MHFVSMQKCSKNHGFTLIELLVVIAIIGLLLSALLVSFSSVRSKARDAKRIADVQQLMKALELFYNENGAYPVSGNCGATLPETDWCNSVESLSDGRWVRNGSTNLGKFLAADPLDPKQGSSPNWLPFNGGTIFYYANNYGGPGQWYMIVFGLENYPHPLEEQDGVRACDGTNFHHGTNSNGIITIGADCTF